MHYGKIYEADVANGPGCRTSLFVSGCRRHCPGCFNRETWDFDFGRPYTPETEEYIIGTLRAPGNDGLTVLGGEPMEPANQQAIFRLLARARMMRKSIWIYTGFTFEELIDFQNEKCHGPVTSMILCITDVLVDGPYVEDLKDISLRFRGSSNQRILDMRKSLDAMKPVLWEGQ